MFYIRVFAGTHSRYSCTQILNPDPYESVAVRDSDPWVSKPMGIPTSRVMGTCNGPRLVYTLSCTCLVLGHMVAVLGHMMSHDQSHVYTMCKYLEK